MILSFLGRLSNLLGVSFGECHPTPPTPARESWSSGESLGVPGVRHLPWRLRFAACVSLGSKFKSFRSRGDVI